MTQTCHYPLILCKYTNSKYIGCTNSYCLYAHSCTIGKCSANIHSYVLREAHLLHRAGLYSTHDINSHLSGKPKSAATARPLSALQQQLQTEPPPITLTSPSQQQIKDGPLSVNLPISSHECLMETINFLYGPSAAVTSSISDIGSPYVCPETFRRFLICFSSLFKEKFTSAQKLKDNLRYSMG